MTRRTRYVFLSWGEYYWAPRLPQDSHVRRKKRKTHVPGIKEEICSMVDKYKPAFMNSWHRSVFPPKICADHNWHVNRNHHDIFWKNTLGTKCMFLSSSATVICHACFVLERMRQKHCKTLLALCQGQTCCVQKLMGMCQTGCSEDNRAFSPLLRPMRGKHAKAVINDACALSLYTAPNQSHQDNKLSTEKNSPSRWYYNTTVHTFGVSTIF